MELARNRAKRNKEFWLMVYTGQGLSYADLRGMDLGEFREAVGAKILFNTEWKPAKAGGQG